MSVLHKTLKAIASILLQCTTWIETDTAQAIDRQTQTNNAIDRQIDKNNAIDRETQTNNAIDRQTNTEISWR